RDAGVGEEQDVASAAARVAAVEATIPPLEFEIKRAEYRIAVLSNVRPGELAIDLSPRAYQPISKMLAIGKPEELLQGRPDVLAAERRLAQASETVLTMQAALPHLGEGASIINIGSVVSSLTPPNSPVYTGTKGAVDAISGVLAKELGARKIRVNSINPGMVETEGLHAAGFIGSDFEKGTVAQTPLGRIGQVDDIASVATFLASNDAKWITGELVRVGGGLR